MTFLEALEEYNKGKMIRRKKWTNSLCKNDVPKIAFDFFIGPVTWENLLADDWIAEDQ